MKQITKKQVNKILIQIHRSFLDKQGAEYSDIEILSGVPRNHLVSKHIQDDNTIAVNAAFTYRWVQRRLKKDPTETAYDMLIAAGFKE